MVRKARQLAPISRRLGFGAVLSFVTMTGALSGASCVDENDPMTYVEQLSDEAKQNAAVKRLVQFYEDKMTEEKKNRQGAKVKELLDKVVEPLTKLCVDGKMQDRTRSTVVKFLADSHDSRAEPCLNKTLTDYKGGTEEDVKWVMTAISETKAPGTADAVLKVFETIKVSEPKASLIYREVNAAVLAIADKKHEDRFIKLIQRPLAADADVPTKKNEAFWQVISAQALGDVKSDKAIPDLLKLLLSPNRAEFAGNTALVALVKIGKPVIEPATNLLKGVDKDLVKYSTEENLKGDLPKDAKALEAAKKAAEKAHVEIAAQVLGSLGRKDVVPPLLSALEGADDATKSVIALQLPNLPKTPASVEAFKTILEKVGNDVRLPNEAYAKEALLGATLNFFDADMVPWLVKLAIDLKGEQETVDALRTKALESAMTLMKGDQVPEVQKLYSLKATVDGKQVDLGKQFEKEFKQASELLTACKEDVDCYLKAALDPSTKTKEGVVKGLKAMYMVAIVGKDGAKMKVLDALPKFENDGLMGVGLTYIESNSPDGDKAVADKLQSLVTKAEESKDQEMISKFKSFKQAIARLNARLQ